MTSHDKYSMHEGHNDSIGCTVTECKFHDGRENYCTLEQIQVTKHETVAKSVQCTDCGSFENQ